MKQNSIRLSDHFTYRRLLSFTLPSILMKVVGSIYSIVDGLFISNFAGSDAFAAVNLIMPIVMISCCIAYMAGSGGSAVVSRLLGEGKHQKALDAFSLISGVLFIISVVLLLVLFAFMPAIATFMGAEGDILKDCVTYGRILTIGLPFFMLQILFQNFLAVAERPKMGLALCVASGITNVVLDAVLVGGFRLGVAGAAVATILGQMLGGVIPAVYFLAKANPLLWFTKIRWNGNILMQTLSNGFSGFLSSFSASLIGLVFDLQLMRQIGADGVAAFGVVMYVSFIVTDVFNGYAAGVAPLFGFNLGCGNKKEARGLLRMSIIVITVLSLLLTTLMLVFARPLSSIFVGYDAELMALSVHAMRLYGLSFYLAGYNIFAAAYFAACSRGKISTTLSVSRILVFQMAAVFVLPYFIGVDGIWLSVPAAEILSFAVTVYFMKKYGFW